MIYNKTFDTYRRSVSSSTRVYSSSKTIDTGNCALVPAGGDLKAILGLDYATKAWEMQTDETNFAQGDKVVIGGSNYHVEQFETFDYGALKFTRVVLLIDS